MSDVRAADLTQQTIDTARRWWTAAGTRPVDASAARLTALLRDPDGLEFARGLADRVVRPDDDRVAAANLDRLSRRTPALLPWHLRAAISFGGGFGPLAPKPIVPVVRRALRHMVGHLVVDAPADKLGAALAALRTEGVQLDVTALGRPEQSAAEADRVTAATRALVERGDVDRVTTSVRALIGPTPPWSFDETSAAAVERLGPLFESAAATEPQTAITLGVERYGDVDLTIDVFTTLLDRPTLRGLSAGIVVQSYLPDALASLQLLTDWSRARVAGGGAPISIRLVKGGERAADEAEARLAGWPPVTFGSKAETDANHKRLVEFALRPENAPVAHVHVAGHNLFDVAHAVTVAAHHGTGHLLDVEMRLGVASALADAVRADVGRIVLAAPIVDPADFDSATGYLVRRLDENADPQGFLSSILDADVDAAFDRERRRYLRSVELMTELDTPPRRGRRGVVEQVDGGTATVGGHADVRTEGDVDDFAPEPDADPSSDDDRRWARRVLDAVHGSVLGIETADASAVADHVALDEKVARAAQAGVGWGLEDAATRAELLDLVANELARQRARLVEVLVSETAVTVSEADREVSAAIDTARRYAALARELESITEAVAEPARLTVVAPPAISPVAATVDRALGALAAGSAVLVMPPPASRRSVAVVAEVLWAAGAPQSLLGVVDGTESTLVEDLVRHPDVDRVELDGSFEVAAEFRSWRPDLDLSARAPSVTSIVVTPNADLERAVVDVVASAVESAGRAAGAASLLVAVGSVGQSASLRRLLRGAVETLRVGPVDSLSAAVGPLARPAEGVTLDALTVLGPGESWLVEPRPLDDRGTLWSPGVRDGVQTGSAFATRVCGAPVLGIVAVDSLADAIAFQNAAESSAVAGLQSLDVDEVDEWLHRVQAGSLVVNRPTTGATVRRRPVAGRGRSVVGAVSAGGGPNALISRLAWRRVDREPHPSLRLHGVSERVTRLVDAARPTLSFEQFDVVRSAVESDERAWQAEFGVARDVSGLVVERNVLRYRPCPVTIRSSEGADLADLVRLLAAAARAGSTVALSSAVPVPAGLVQLMHGTASPVRVRDVVVETDAAFLSRAAAGALQLGVTGDDGPDVLDLLARAAGATEPVPEEARVDDSRPVASTEAVASYRGLTVRLIGGDPRALAHAVQGSPDVTIYSGDVTAEGRVELLTFVREQSVAITTLRLGTIDAPLAALPL